MHRAAIALIALTSLAAGPSLAAEAEPHAHTQPTAARTPEAAGEAGQAAFAAISEIVDRLVADPTTDWSKVNIDTLRAHLADMDDVLLRARVTTSPLPTGAVFDVTGETTPVQAAIRRMALAHAAMINGVAGQSVVATATPQGVRVRVTGDAAMAVKIRALGFFGLLAEGGHHGPHHWMMATGAMAHEATALQ